MTFLTQHDLKRLATELAVANTGSYIFRRFSDDPMVRAMALRPPDQLLTLVKTADSETQASLDIEVEGYAAAVALALGDGLPTLEQYALARPKGMKWLPHVIAAARTADRSKVAMQSVGKNEYAFKLSPGAVTVSTSTAPAAASGNSVRIILP